MGDSYGIDPHCRHFGPVVWRWWLLGAAQGTLVGDCWLRLWQKSLFSCNSRGPARSKNKDDMRSSSFLRLNRKAQLNSGVGAGRIARLCGGGYGSGGNDYGENFHRRLHDHFSVWLTHSAGSNKCTGGSAFSTIVVGGSGPPAAGCRSADTCARGGAFASPASVGLWPSFS